MENENKKKNEDTRNLFHTASQWLTYMYSAYTKHFLMTFWRSQQTQISKFSMSLVYWHLCLANF